MCPKKKAMGLSHGLYLTIGPWAAFHDLPMACYFYVFRQRRADPFLKLK